MTRLTLVIAAAAFLALGMAPVRAGTTEDATAAYQRGDYPLAMRLSLGLADEGEPMAFSILGLMHASGQGVPQNFTEAARWYRLAAEQGVAVSQASLAGLYFEGKGVPRDVAEAIRLYRLAAEQGDASAQFNLASIYEGGRGVNPDYTEAIYWFRRAAALGNPSARYSLAGMYQAGRGAAQDDVRAYMWLDFASSTGWRLAVNAKNKLAKRMTADQIVQARRMYLSCLESGFELCD